MLNTVECVMETERYDQEFKDSFRKIALPVGLQNLLFTSLSFIDSLMVGKLGQAEYNAVGLAAQYTFIIHLIAVGISSAAMIYMSQYFGNKDIKGFKSASGLGMITCTALGLLAGLAALLIPESIMSLFTKEPAIINHGVRYLSIVAFQLPLALLTLTIAKASRVSQNAKLPLKISIVSLSINTILNYILIFGKFGFPALGVAGAAYATLTSSALSLILYIIIINSSDNPLRGSLRDYFDISKSFIIKVFKTGWTVILHEYLWSLGMSLFVLILSRMSTDGYTAYQIASQFASFAFIFAMAVSSSASVTIGILLGRKDIEKALAYEKKYSRVQLLLGVMMSVVVISVTYFAVDLFKVSSAIRTAAFYTTIAECIFLPLRTYSGMQAAGILRAGGDTKVPVFMELIGTYFVDVPILFILLRFTSLNTPLIIFFSSTGAILTSVLLYGRVKSRSWAKNLISDEV